MTPTTEQLRQIAAAINPELPVEEYLCHFAAWLRMFEVEAWFLSTLSQD